MEQSKANQEEIAALKSGGGDGTSGDMDGRVSKLEAHVDHIRDDMRDVKADLKAIIGTLGKMPTKSDLDTWKWQWLAASVAIFAVVVGTIVGALGWLASIAR